MNSYVAAFVITVQVDLGPPARIEGDACDICRVILRFEFFSFTC